MRPPVAFLLDNLQVGGTELNAVRTAELLVGAGVPLTVFAMQSTGPLRERYLALGTDVIPRPLGGSLASPTAVRQGLGFARRMREAGVAILHCHDRYSNIFGALWCAPTATRGLITSRRWDQREGRAALRRLNRLAFRRSSAVIGNSERVCQALAEEDGVATDRIVLVPNFVEAAAFAPPSDEERRRSRSSHGLPVDQPVVGIVANLRPVKDHGMFLRAAAVVLRSHPDTHFAVIGEGGERAALEGLAAELGIGARVRFLGPLPNRPNPFHLVDIAALTSRSEGFPNTILEAMAAGRPVVSTAVGGVPDAVSEGVTGFMVAPGAVEPFAAALGRLLADPELSRAMGEAGRRTARERYGDRRMLEVLTALYARIPGGA